MTSEIPTSTPKSKLPLVARHTNLLRRCLWLLPLALLLAVGALYGRVLGYELLNLDDWTYTVANPLIANGLDAHALTSVWTSLRYNAIWMPITWLSYALDLTCATPHNVAAWLHAQNLFWHLLNATLLGYLLRRKGVGMLLTSAVATAWVVHPLMVETVAWIACRKDLLLGTTLLLSAHLWLGSERQQRWANLPLILGCLCKPTALFLPIILWLLRPESLRTFCRKLAPALVMTVTTFCIGVTAQSLGEVPHHVGSIKGALSALGRYYALPVLPIDLHAPYFRMVPMAWCFGLAIPVILLARRYWRLVAIYTLPLLPVLGLVSIGFQSAADRFLYLPLLAILVALLPQILRMPRWSAYLLFALAIGEGALTHRYLSYWRDDTTLAERALQFEAKDNALLNRMIGMHQLCTKGNPQRAATHLAQAFRTDPQGNSRLRIYYALALASSGRPTFALKAVNPIIQPGATYPPHQRYTALALVQRTSGPALAYLAQAIASQPNYPPACAMMAAFALQHPSFQPNRWLERAAIPTVGRPFTPEAIRALQLPWLQPIKSPER